MMLVQFALAIVLAAPDTNRLNSRDSVGVPAADSAGRSGEGLQFLGAPADTLRRRPHSVTYSDAYALRLEVHRIGSYTMLPLFAAEFALGQNLINDSHPSGWLKPTHVGVALGVGALFTLNTTTGALNFWESRHDPADRAKRWIHASLMVASDAGFVWTGAIAGGRRNVDQQQHHKNVALGSMALSTLGTAMMWLWKN